MVKSSVHHVEIQRFSPNGILATPDLLTVEEPLEIRLRYGRKNDRKEFQLAITMRTPGSDFELVYGFLFSENIIENYGDVSNIRHCLEVKSTDELENVIVVEIEPHVNFQPTERVRNFYMNSGCGVCGKASVKSIRQPAKTQVEIKPFKIDAGLICHLPHKLLKAQVNFRNTGGIHASGLFTKKGEILLSREDIGRHNALDKIIGAALKNSIIPLTQHILVLSGRMSFDLLQKAVRVGVPVIVAVGAPSSLAVKVAEEFNITLIGFTKEKSFNLYSSPERIYGTQILCHSYSWNAIRK